METFFKMKERGTTRKTEMMAGLTTFMAMSYVLLANPGMFKDLGVVSYNAIYIATALSSVVGTLLIGLLANLPLAQATGMGLNAFFVYTVCGELGFTYANALVFVLFNGVLFVILTLTGVRKILLSALPEAIKTAIPAGIGLFICFIGLKSSGIIVSHPSSFVTLASFNFVQGKATWGTIMPLLVTILTLVLIAVMTQKKINGAILWSILIGTASYYLLGLTVPGFFDQISVGTLNPFSAFGEFAEFSLFQVFTDGFDFSAYLETHSIGTLILTFASSALAFCLVSMFDSFGTLFGACKSGNMLVVNEKGEEEVPNLNKALLADALGTCASAVCGTSTLTAFVESSSGVAAGGRTGFSALVTGGLFFVAMFLSPVAALIPACAYSAALIYVGVLMMGCVTEINWKNPADALPCFMAIVMMPFTYNISYGIAFGILTYMVIMILTGKIKKLSVGTWIISFLFIAMFLLTH